MADHTRTPTYAMATNAMPMPATPALVTLALVGLLRRVSSSGRALSSTTPSAPSARRTPPAHRPDARASRT
eukprot:3120572-Prymnesium_polylepis.1